MVAISAGWNHSLALKAEIVYAWGANQFGGATGVPTTNFPQSACGPVIIDGQILSDVVAIAAGDDYSLALKKDGTVVPGAIPLA